ncbi:uncharacterized protein LOC123555543 isoform X2 [Mercenaria mercenaria]|uniref:uncharacterized protein LOC123555543 isoform X2 n=1 Tax=Mercenaria mercenaria TaxID=6596 RepID=UPI001E1E156A|nr:uncharacterized protein LOC123555543 isoform X2 [Mercenaria mercenaria]
MNIIILITILLALILTTVIELSTLFGLVVYWRVAREAPVQPRLCFPSSAFASNVDDLQKLKKENDMYCGNASYVLHILVNQTVAEKYNNNANPEHSTIDFRGDSCTPSDTDGLMLKLDSISLHAKPVPGRPTKIYWKTSTKFNKMQDMQFSVDEGSLYILKSGYYYISSQLTSRVENKTIGESNDQTLGQFLISYRDGTERILLEDAKSPCELAVEQSEHTSTIGAVFYLEEREQIYVATSHPYHLLSGDSINYLSILKT